MKNVIFLAPPAAGKGTFSELLIQKYGYQHISSGELLRDEALKNKELAKDLENGQLISDEVVMKLVVDKLHSSFTNSNFILDGIPRTFNQVHLLEQYIQLDQFVVIYIHVDKSVLLKRVLGRRVCPNCEKNYNVSFEKFRPKIENVCDVCSSSLIKRTDDTEEGSLKFAIGLEPPFLRILPAAFTSSFLLPLLPSCCWIGVLKVFFCSF